MIEVISELLRYRRRRARTHLSYTVESSFQVRLPSRLRGAYFLATIKLVWPESYAKAGLQTLAERQMLCTAQKVAAKYSVLDRDEARMQIDYELSGSLDLLEANVRLIEANVALETSQADRELAEKQEELFRDIALHRAQQQKTMDQLRFLGERVLTDPGLIRLWWLDGRRDKLPELVQLNSMFEAARALFTGQTDRSGPDPITDLIRQFLQGLGPEQREYLIDQLRHIFIAYEQGGLADRLPAVLRPSGSSA